MRALSLCLSVAFLICSGAARCESSRSVTIIIENRSPDFSVAPTIEVFGAASQPFEKRDDAHFEYKILVPETEWFKQVDIKLNWKNDFLRNDGKKTDFGQRISLRVRRDFPSSFTFPVFFSNDRSQKELYRLENMKNVNDQFEVFFRAGQIASYYRDVLGAQHALSKRASKMFFSAAVELAQQPNYFVIMDDDAESFVTEALGDPSYSVRASQARSVYWFDLRLIDAYVGKGDCRTAQMLLAVFQSLKSDDPTAFKLRYGADSNVLDQKGLIVAKCGRS